MSDGNPSRLELPTLEIIARYERLSPAILAGLALMMARPSLPPLSAKPIASVGSGAPVLSAASMASMSVASNTPSLLVSGSPAPVNRLRFHSSTFSNVASSRSFSALDSMPLPFRSTSTVWRDIEKLAVPMTKPKTFSVTAPSVNSNSTSLVSFGLNGVGNKPMLSVTVAQLMRWVELLPPASVALLTSSFPLKPKPNPPMPPKDALPITTSRPR